MVSIVAYSSYFAHYKTLEPESAYPIELLKSRRKKLDDVLVRPAAAIIGSHDYHTYL